MKVDGAYYGSRLLPELMQDCNQLLHAGFIFHQDSAPVHTACFMQDWLQANSPDFIEKDQWPLNSPDLNPLDYHIYPPTLGLQHYRNVGDLTQAGC